MKQIEVKSHGVSARITCDDSDLFSQIKADLESLNDTSVAKDEFSIDIFLSKRISRPAVFFSGRLIGLGVDDNFSVVCGNDAICISRNANAFYAEVFDPDMAWESLRLLLFSEWIWRIGKLKGWLPVHAMAYEVEGKGFLVIGPMYAGKSNLARHTIQNTSHRLLGDELIWFDGKYLYPFCTSIRYRKPKPEIKSIQDLNQKKSFVFVPIERIAKRAELFDARDLNPSETKSGHGNCIRDFFTFFIGIGLPQMLVLNLNPFRFFSASRTLLLRFKLALKLANVFRRQSGERTTTSPDSILSPSTTDR